MRRNGFFIEKTKKLVSLAFQQNQPFRNRTSSRYKRVSGSLLEMVFFQQKHTISAAGIPTDFQRKTSIFHKKTSNL